MASTGWRLLSGNQAHKGDIRAITALFLFALLSRFYQIGLPNEVVFDEVHWGRYFSSYFTGRYYFDIHPPLGKLIYAGWAYCLGFDSAFVFESGVHYAGSWYIGLRALPSLVGALLPVVIFGLGRSLGMRVAPAFLPAWMVALDGALVDMSRFILLDTFLLFFGFSAILIHQKWLKEGCRWAIPLTGILCALSFSIKWTGLTFLLFILFRQGFHVFVRKHSGQWMLLCWSLLVLPAVLYMLQFWLHFELLPDTGPGDAFMSPAFQATLSGNPIAQNSLFSPPTFFEKFVELNRVMYSASATMTTSHPYGSPWYSWPLMLRPIYLWVGGLDRKIYLLGNPVIWWGSAVFTLAAMQFVVIFRRSNRMSGIGLLLLGWALNWLPFAGIRRVMFVYHYLPALMFSLLLVGALINTLSRPNLPTLLLALLVLCTALYFAPITYGFPSSWPIFWMASWT